MTGALAFALRGTALALRFALPLALIRLLGLEATGQFALVAATAAIAPAALGWGLNNLMTRDLVLQPADAPRLITTRLAVTGASITIPPPWARTMMVQHVQAMLVISSPLNKRLYAPA